MNVFRFSLEIAHPNHLELFHSVQVVHVTEVEIFYLAQPQLWFCAPGLLDPSRT